MRNESIDIGRVDVNTVQKVSTSTCETCHQCKNHKSAIFAGKEFYLLESDTYYPSWSFPIQRPVCIFFSSWSISWSGLTPGCQLPLSWKRTRSRDFRRDLECDVEGSSAERKYRSNAYKLEIIQPKKIIWLIINPRIQYLKV